MDQEQILKNNENHLMSFRTYSKSFTNRFNVIAMQMSPKFQAENLNDNDIKLIGRV